MGITERREREREEMRRNILDIAMKLFVEDGYENVSFRKIAERIEYSPATIYLYFKDKNEIFYRLHENAFNDFYQALSPAMAIKNPIERLIKLAERYIQFAVENPERYDLMFILKAPLNQLKDESGCGFESFDVLRQTVAEAIEHKLIKAGNVDVAALSLWSQVHGFASLLVCDRLYILGDVDISKLIRDFLKFIEENTL